MRTLAGVHGELSEMLSKRPDFQALYDALPFSGKTERYTTSDGVAAAGHLHAKTGTLWAGDPLNKMVLVTGKGLAGYMTTAAGRNLSW